jgi:hypothetical protein
MPEVSDSKYLPEQLGGSVYQWTTTHQSQTAGISMFATCALFA